MPRQVGYVIGSLRKDSYNRKLANALIRLGPPDFNFKELRIGDLPLYDQDDDRSQAPEVQRLKSELRAVDALTLEVRDNGHGISEDAMLKQNHFGILGMRERAILLGGGIVIDGAPGEGTQLVVRVPQS